jgi:hypothetical protein
MLLFALTALAQTNQGTITGRVTDPTGGVIPQVQVTVTNLDTGVVYPGVTNDLGIYSILYLPVGRYGVEYKKDGFKTFQQRGVTISTDQVVRLDVALAVGSVTQNVTVTANAAMLTPEQTTTETNLKAPEMEVLPFNMIGDDDATYWIGMIIPAATGWLGDSSFAGSMINTVGSTVDGVSDDYGPQGSGYCPGMEAIQEMDVQTSGIRADGPVTGGGVVAYTLRSGTNKFHGSVYGLLANEALDANTWEDNYFGLKLPRDRYNIWGIRWDGPVYIPHLYDGRNKTFVMGSWEKMSQTDLRRVADGTTTPTTDFLQGNFSALLGAPITDSNGNPITVQNNAGQTVPLQQGMIFDPATQNAFTGNVIPSNRISAQTQKLLGYYSLYQPTNSSLVNNYPSMFNGQPNFAEARWDGKVDENISTKNHLSWSYDRYAVPYTYDSGSTLWSSSNMGPLTSAGAGFYTANGMRLIDTWTISPTVVNTFAIADNWNVNTGYDPSPVDDQALGFPTFGRWAKVLPSISFGCADTFEQVCESSLGSGSNQWQIQREYHFKDDVMWVKGRHTLHFGGELRHSYNYIAPSAGGLSYTFNSATGLPAALYNNTQVSQYLGFGFANFLLGDVGSASQGEGISASGGIYQLSFVGGDKIKATPNLTLDIGWRYDYNGRLHANDGRWPNFDLNAQNPTWAPLNGQMEWTTNSSQSWYANEDYKLFAPSLGGAYKISKKFVARSSFSVMYLPMSMANGPTPFTNQVGYVPTDLATSAPNAYAFNWDQNIYAGVYTAPTRNPDANAMYPWSITSVDPNILHLGHTLNWNADLEYEISPNTMLEVSYIANIARGIKQQNPDPTNYPTLNSYLPLLQSGHAGDFITTADGATAANVAWYPFLPTMQGGMGGYPAYAAVDLYPQVAATGTPIEIAGKSIGSSQYRALVVELKKRFSHDLTADVNYAWQLETGNVANNPTNFSQGGSSNENFAYNPFQNPWAYKSYTHTVVQGFPIDQLKGYFSYMLPFGTGKHFLSDVHLLNHLVGGWQLGGVIGAYTGFPLHAVAPSFSYPGWSAVYANRVGSLANHFSGKLDLTNLADPSNMMFSPTSFQDPTFGQFGNQQLYSNSFRSWAYDDEDASIAKNFFIGKDNRVKLVFRAEFFDLPNRHHWDDPNVSATNTPYFGAVTGVYGQRHGQVSARVEW